jgi:predicted ATPase
MLGRDEELQAVTEELLLDEVRLLTLTGPAGIGKTRLALALAEHMLGSFADGVWFVNLAACTDPAQVAPAIGRALGLANAAQDRWPEAVQARLRQSHTLLSLDNFEQVLGAAPMVADLLVTCPHLTILVTSREALRLHWEHVFLVPPLVLPDLGRAATRDELLGFACVELFLTRAQSVKRDLELSERAVQAIAQICVRLDGLPLAIELAAAHAHVLSPAAMVSRLDSHLSLLRWEGQDSPPRHRTMRAALDWSYDLLGTRERGLLRRLAVFAGGFTTEAAQAVAWPDAPQADLLTLLTALVDKNMLQCASRSMANRASACRQRFETMHERNWPRVASWRAWRRLTRPTLCSWPRG